MIEKPIHEQTSAGMPTIDTAPKDGTEIYSFDGTWWRDRTKWDYPLGERVKVEEFRAPKRWLSFAFLPISPTHWCHPRDATPQIERMIAAGYAPVGSQKHRK